MLNLTNDGINEFTIDCDKFLIDTLRECNMYTYLWDMGAVRWNGDALTEYEIRRIPMHRKILCRIVRKPIRIIDRLFDDAKLVHIVVDHHKAPVFEQCIRFAHMQLKIAIR